ncbi:hypothetical protein [Pseudarthrobacter sp. NamB4]|uniref:hypothetical protein n=1 Tax=Pseudarthrobacter sp. NamB4 TaxID=2576837 RepID=UPI0010FE6FB2|nr:hypothetical protein [Pseudarthrobacter sp. NamB4]TLM71599.1 hypothetical protein FDW81_15740 [Pseudarthrobacter sp. NamB4]
MLGDRLEVVTDSRHLVGSLTVPLEEADLSLQELASLPVEKGWGTISTGRSPGIRVEDLESMFGLRAAVIVLGALADALLSEAINADLYGRPYLPMDLAEDNRYEEILAMQRELQQISDADESLRAVRNAFDQIMKRKFPL